MFNICQQYIVLEWMILPTEQGWWLHKSDLYSIVRTNCYTPAIEQKFQQPWRCICPQPSLRKKTSNSTDCLKWGLGRAHFWSYWHRHHHPRKHHCTFVRYRIYLKIIKRHKCRLYLEDIPTKLLLACSNIPLIEDKIVSAFQKWK